MTEKSKRILPVLFALFALYVLVILFILVFSYNYRGRSVFVGGLTWERRLDYVLRNFKFVPFRGIAEQISGMAGGQHVARNLIYLVENVVGFIPLGFFICHNGKIKAWNYFGE